MPPVESNSSPNVTKLLHDWGHGDARAMDELLPLIYDELRRRAAAYLRRERPNHSLQATALVNEAYLRLVDQHKVVWKNRGHFFAIAAQVMRRILVDHARNRHRDKRGGPVENVSLKDSILALPGENDVDIIALEEALSRLASIDAEKERLVELRYFVGLSLEDAADVLKISRATATREWKLAKAWLFRELTR